MTEPTAPPLVEAIDITQRFGSTVALRDARLRVLAGESHALVGRNGAGKSTLVSVLTGLLAPNAGEVRFDGEPAPPPADRDAWRSRVACVYQHSTAIPELTVGENLFLNRQPTSGGGRISWRKLRAQARELLDHWDVRVDTEARVGDLTVENRQLVEIARALSYGARFIILDEPTAQLDSNAIDRLFARMRALQSSGVTFLYISHHLQEVYEVCQTVTVMRDARTVTTAPVADLPQAALVEAMTGETAPESATAPGGARAGGPGDRPVRLDVRGLAGDGFAGVDLTVRTGEVVGLAGSSSSGKVALGETVAGLRAPASGAMALDGTPLPGGDVPGALRAGVGLVPRDRHDEGLVPDLSVAENATMTAARGLGPYGVVVPRRRRAAAQRAIADLGVVTEGPDQPVGALSGGNQQKVVMARALATDPKLLVLINPTAGVDVKSKQALLDVIDAVRTTGTSVLVISDELDDLRACDRVLVFFHGRVAAEYPAGWRDGDLVGAIEGMSDD
ncbi:MAG TPA: sugar ABC transporter ATP-binding protein [Streptosporangiaceae bacterium]|jgi:simple sugar transport system ATP-binding protein